MSETNIILKQLASLLIEQAELNSDFSDKVITKTLQNKENKQSLYHYESN